MILSLSIPNYISLTRSISIFLLLLFFIHSSTIIDRPVIGIISVPTSCNQVPQTDDKYSYINSDYVKWLEFNGANVVPIPYDSDVTKLRFFFERINGVLFPGGDCPLMYNSTFLNAQNYFYQWSLEKFEFFPIWGTCQGFEALFIFAAQSDKVVDRSVNASQVNLPLIFNGKVNSRIFRNVSENIINIFKQSSVTFNWHEWGLTPETYNKTKSLNSFFDIVTEDFDLNGKKFISTVEAKNFPIYGSQWHPEMVLFADLPANIRHSYDAVMANQVTSSFFVNECRKSSHRFKEGEQMDDYTIENFGAEFTGKYEKDSRRQTYFFKNQHAKPKPKPPKKKDKTIPYEYIAIGVVSGMVCCCGMCCIVFFVCFLDRIVSCIVKRIKEKSEENEERTAMFDEDAYGDIASLDMGGEQNSSSSIHTTQSSVNTNQSGVSFETDKIVDSLFK